MSVPAKIAGTHSFRCTVGMRKLGALLRTYSTLSWLSRPVSVAATIAAAVITAAESVMVVPSADDLAIPDEDPSPGPRCLFMENVSIVFFYSLLCLI